MIKHQKDFNRFKREAKKWIGKQQSIGQTESLIYQGLFYRFNDFMNQILKQAWKDEPNEQSL